MQLLVFCYRLGEAAGALHEALMNDKASRDPERYRLHAEVCRVLTDPKRLMLLDVLRDGEHSVGQLAEELGCNLANVSQHLAVLRSAGLVETRRVGTTILYSLAEPELVEACDVIHRIVGRRLANRGAPRASVEQAIKAKLGIDGAPHY
jgi:ArsR family transcriptional regulator